MSLTTTDNPLTYATVRLLADYDLQHSDIPEGTTPAAPNPHPAPANVENPPDWETNWRRVPAYRPADPEIDFEFRNTYNNNIERAFLWHMFRGVRLVSVSGVVNNNSECD